MTEVRLECGSLARHGAVVFNYYDREWGTIDLSRIDADGWFDFTNEEGRRRTLNGARCSAYDPQGTVPRG